MIDHDISMMKKLEDLLANSEKQVDSLSSVNQQHEQFMGRLNQSRTAVMQWRNKAMRRLTKTLYTAADTDVTILLQGETGIGKEVFAREIVSHSSRRNRPFIKVNCAALPAALIESELFGYAKGAFTGADSKGRLGAFELANHGTLFLDEVGEIPLEFQAKLLRAIQEKEVTRVGTSKPVSVDFRLIAATNQNLQEKVSAGLFRADLFYRLNVVPICIPPLRERSEDIELLLEQFIEKYNRKYKKKIRFEPLLLSKLKEYRWPGNIREMENIIERWCVLYPADAVIRWADVQSSFDLTAKEEAFDGKTLAELMAAYEREVLNWGLRRYGTQRAAAEALGVHYSTISKLCKRLDVD